MRDEDCREIFDQVKEQLTQLWKNHYLNQVFRLAYAELDTYLFANDAEKKTMSKILEDFDYDAFKAMQSQWLKTGRMIWYSYGNLTKEQSKEIVDQAVSLMALQSVPKDSLPAVRIIDLSG